jgi:UDP-3-O-[3-hydroxymyristoyl] glucosamine N-acyltransferase
MKLSDFFDKNCVLFDANFDVPYSQYFVAEKCIAYIENIELLEKLSLKTISALITKKELVEYLPEGKGIVICENPQKEFFNLHNRLALEKKFSLVLENYIHESARIASSAIIGKNVQIGANVQIGDYVIIKDNTIIGENTRIESNAIIGACGMQTSYLEDKTFYVEHLGGVKIGNYCKILEGAIIQKPYQAYYTEIGDYSTISVHVNIGHGSKIGKSTLIAGKAQISGLCTIGDNVWIGPSAIIADNIRIGDNAKIRIGSIVIRNVKEGDDVSGNFATNHNSNLKNYLKQERWKKNTN